MLLVCGSHHPNLMTEMTRPFWCVRSLTAGCTWARPVKKSLPKCLFHGTFIYIRKRWNYQPDISRYEAFLHMFPQTQGFSMFVLSGQKLVLTSIIFLWTLQFQEVGAAEMLRWQVWIPRLEMLKLHGWLSWEWGSPPLYVYMWCDLRRDQIISIPGIENAWQTKKVYLYFHTLSIYFLYTFYIPSIFPSFSIIFHPQPPFLRAFYTTKKGRHGIAKFWPRDGPWPPPGPSLSCFWCLAWAKKTYFYNKQITSLLNPINPIKHPFLN